MKRNWFVLVLILAIGGLLMAYPLNNDYAQPVREQVETVEAQVETVEAQLENGWISEPNTWTYDSADSPTFVASVNADMTGILSPGMRVRLTQTTVKYFIVTAVGSYSGGATLITLYGGTDYTLANAAISSPGYSHMKAPFGFPLNPDTWTVKITITMEEIITSPVALTWYDVASIDIPTGVWNVSYDSWQFVSISNTGTGDIYTTLSTSASSDSSDGEHVHFFWAYGSGGAGTTAQKSFVLNLASKTTYYLNIMNDLSNPFIQIDGQYFPTIIRAVCAYL